MKVHFINVSDFPALISYQEQTDAHNTFQRYNISSENHVSRFPEENVKIFNQLMNSPGKEMIMFSSGGMNAINRIGMIHSMVHGEKILVGFSDTLHVQALFSHEKNVLNIYGLTMRNLSSLSGADQYAFFNLLDNSYYRQALVSKHNREKIEGTLYGGHIMVYVTTLLLYGKSKMKGEILYLEFHGLSNYYIFYYLDILKILGVFDNGKGVIFDLGYDIDLKTEDFEKYAQDNLTSNIYFSHEIPFLPLYKFMSIETGILMLQN